MSTSLRDQLLQAGLVTQKQVKDAERQERHTRIHAKPERKAEARKGDARKGNVRKADGGKVDAHRPAAASPVAAAVASAAAAKVARDQELNRRQQEKARRKALHAEVAQLIAQHRLPPATGDDFYNFVDGSKIRHIAVLPETRAALIAGSHSIVCHGGRYDVVTAAVAARIHERDPGVAIFSHLTQASVNQAADGVGVDPLYADFPVPDDLTW